MRLTCDPTASHVLVDLRATGPLAVFGHDPTLTARPAPFSVEVAEADSALDVPVAARFSAAAIEPPSGASAADGAKLRENMLSREVLDAARHPDLVLEGRYTGTLEEGTLAATLLVRGAPRPLSIPVRVAASESIYTVTGRWAGTLTALGVKPFKALLGALRLEDWICLRLDVRLRRA